MYRYILTITPETKRLIADLARDCGHTVSLAGPQFGDGSIPRLLTELAVIYAQDPNRVVNALKRAGVVRPAEM